MPKVKKRAMMNPERKKEALYEERSVWQNWMARVFVIIIMCVHPLYLTYERYGDLTRHKYEFFVVCMGIAIFAVFVIWISRMTEIPRLWPRDKLDVIDFAILGFAVITILSALLSPYRMETDVWGGYVERHDGAVTQLFYVAIFFIVSRWYKSRTLDITFFGISAILVALIGIFQFYGMDFFKLWPYHVEEFSVYSSYNIFFRTTLGNVNIVSSFVCIATLLCGFMFIKIKSKWWSVWLAASALNFWLMEIADADSGRIGLLVTMVLAIPFIIESRKTLGKTLILASSWIGVYTLQKLLYEVLSIQTREAGSLLMFAAVALVPLAIGLVLVRWANEPCRQDEQARPKWKLGVILIALCLVVGVAGVEVLGRQNPETGNTNIIYELREILHGNIRDEFATYRVYIWRNALDAFKNNPIIGSGPDTFYYAFPAQAHRIINNEHYENAHNEYIQILVCQGIIGLACYLVFIFGLLIKSIPKAFNDPLLMAVLVAFAGYCIQAFFNLSIPIVTPTLWIFAGILAGMLRKPKEA